MKNTAFALAWVLAAIACSPPASSVPDAGFEDRDVTVAQDRTVPPDRQILRDSLPDAPDRWDATRPSPTQYDFCDQPIWAIPHEASDDLAIYVEAMNGTNLGYQIEISGTQNNHVEYYYFDMATGLQRRLTTEATPLGAGMFMSLPRAIFYVPQGQYYVVNLQALGIIDDQGRLLDGPPLQEITDLGL